MRMNAQPLLEARGVVKHFGHVHALRGVDFAVHAGEIVGLVGDNGAGKSTLVKVMSGALRPDGGETLIDGDAVRLDGPAHARRYGVESVHQELALAPDLDAAENLYLGRELRAVGWIGRLGFMHRRAMTREATRYFAELGVPLPSVSIPVRDLSGGQRQIVAVARAAAFSGRVVFLDEPTAALAVEPARRVMDLIQGIRSSGVGVVLITHDLPRVFELADRIQVLRLGRIAGSVIPSTGTMDEVVGLMTGAAGSRDVVATATMSV